MTTRKLLTAAMAGNSFLMMTTSNARGLDQQPEVVFAVSSTSLSHTNNLPQRTGDSSTLYLPADSFAAIKAIKAPEVPMNPAVAKYVQDYIRKNNEVLQKVEARSSAIFKVMEPILFKYDIPVELKYLAVVESDLKRTAVSRVGAAGPWQLMPATARGLGLKVSKKNDERKHYYKSTTAAALYLRDLYNEYGDWLLVIAAYNAGPGNINRAIKKAGSRNFWKLQYFLPAETRGHVKRFISTHYFFEDCGSETTLTKAENLMYAKAMAQFTALQCETEETKLQQFASSDIDVAKETAKTEVMEASFITKQK